MYPKIIIGSPIRNRAWILRDYLNALEQIDYPNKEFIFLENDSDDDTYSILLEWIQGKGTLYSVQTQVKEWSRGEYAINQYENLANIRNRFIEYVLKTDAEYLLSVDSDIIVQPNILKELLKYADSNTIIGAAISNVPNKLLDGKTPGNFMINRNGTIYHPNPYPLSGLIDVDVIGAVYLIPRKALEECRYAPHGQGEDIPFCIQVKVKGFNMKVYMDVVCDHRMERR